MEPKEFTFAKVGTGPNVAPPTQTPKPKVKPSGQGIQRGCFSPDSSLDISDPPLRPGQTKCYGENSFAYGQYKIFQDDPQPIQKPKKTYFRDSSGKFAKKPSKNPMPRVLKNV